MNSDNFAIIGLTLYIGPFYAGDHIHYVTITQSRKFDFTERGVKEFTEYEDVEKHLYGITD